MKQIGLQWMAKNYAMGGMASGEEIPLCFNSIFGRDIDSISWDYGMVKSFFAWGLGTWSCVLFCHSCHVSLSSKPFLHAIFHVL